MRDRRNCLLSLICWTFLISLQANAFHFSVVNLPASRLLRCSRRPLKMASSGQGFGGATTAVHESETAEDLSKLSTMQVKDRLLKLLPSMMGTQEEFRLVEQYVNALEQAHVPVQTLGFLNLAMTGEWQLVRSILCGRKFKCNGTLICFALHPAMRATKRN